MEAILGGKAAPKDQPKSNDSEEDAYFNTPGVEGPRLPKGDAEARALESMPDWAKGGLKDLKQFREEIGPIPSSKDPDGGTVARLDVGGVSFYGVNAHRMPIRLRGNAISR